MMKNKIVKKVVLAVAGLALLLPVAAYATAANPTIRNQAAATRANTDLTTAARNFNTQLDRIETLRRNQARAYARLIARQEAAEARLIERQRRALATAYARLDNVYRTDADRVAGNPRTLGIETRFTNAYNHRNFAVLYTTTTNAALNVPDVTVAAGGHITRIRAFQAANPLNPGQLYRETNPTVDYANVNIDYVPGIGVIPRPANWRNTNNADWPTLSPWRRGAGFAPNNTTDGMPNLPTAP